MSGSPTVSADFDEFWDSIGKRNVKQLMPRLAARAAWNARQPEIDALQAENRELRRVRDAANAYRVDEDHDDVCGCLLCAALQEGLPGER